MTDSRKPGQAAPSRRAECRTDTPVCPPSGYTGQTRVSVLQDTLGRLPFGILASLPPPATAMSQTADDSGSSEHAERIAAAYRDNYALLSALARRRFRVPEADVQSVIHEVFVSYIRHEQQIRDHRAWLVGAVCKASRKYWSHAEREEATDLADCVDPKPLLDTLTARLDAVLALRQLGDRCREVVRLRFFEGLDFDELASRFSITSGSAKLKLARCMQTARQLIRGIQTKGRA
jgi:RNA polymerase sigma factor (sigma-70 family)